MALTQEQIQKARELAQARGGISSQQSTGAVSLIEKYGIGKPAQPALSLKERVGSVVGDIAGSVAKPVENVIRSAVAPVAAGIKSVAKGTDFGTEYDQTLEKLKTAPSVTSIISGGQQQSEARDLSDEKTELAGDVLQSIPLVKGAKMATSIAQKVAPIAGKAAGVVAGAAVPAYTLDVGMGLSEGEELSEAAQPGLATGIGTAIPLAPYLIRAIGSAGKKTGEKIVEAVIPKSMQEAQILQAYKSEKGLFQRIGDILKGTSKPPQGAYKTTVEKGLMGTKSMIGIQSKRASEKLWKGVISPRLKASPTKVSMPQFLEDERQKIMSEVSDPGRRDTLLEALDAIKDDFKGVDIIDMEQLQKYKEGWAEFVPDKAYRGKPIAGVYNDVRNRLAGKARQTIYDDLGDDVKQAYFDYGNLKGLQEMGVVSMTGQKLKGGSFTGLAELLSQAVTPIGTIAGRAIYKLSNGLEIVGKAGARTLEEAVGLGSATTKEGQVLSQPINTQTSQTTPNQNIIQSNVSNIDESISQSTKAATQNVEKSIPKVSNYVEPERLANGDRIVKGVNVDEVLRQKDVQVAKLKEEMNRKPPTRTYDPMTGKITDVSKKGKGINTIPEIEAKIKEIKARPKVFGTENKTVLNFYKEKLAKLKSESIPKELQPLAEEARKYKSAESFIKAQGTPVYHGTPNKFDGSFREPVKGQYGNEAIFFAKDKSGASQFTRESKNGEIKEIILPKNIKLWDFGNPDDVKLISDAVSEKGLSQIDKTWIAGEEKWLDRLKKGDYSLIQRPEVLKILRDNGYDGFTQKEYFNYGLGDSIGIFSPENIKTKQQLIDIWERTNSKK